MKKSVWIGVVVLLGVFFFVAALAQEGILWVGKFSMEKVKNGIPQGWDLEKKTGEAIVRVEKTGNDVYVHFICNDSSFGLKKDLNFSIQDYPYLNWKWKVTQLPEKGNFLNKETDDQAAQIYVAFPRFPQWINTELVGYLWESQAKNKGKEGESPAWSKSRVIVLEAGPEKLNQWVQEKRNVYADYKKLFQKEPPKVGAISIYINSQHTQAKAESFFDDIYFSKN